MSHQSEVMYNIHKRINSAVAEIRKIEMNARFIDDVSLEMQLISNIESMLDGISDAVYSKARAIEDAENE